MLSSTLNMQWPTLPSTRVFHTSRILPRPGNSLLSTYWLHWTTLKAKVQARSYDSQYDFDTDVILLSRVANDFHFNLLPGVVGSNQWAWSLQYSLTSFSSDGKALPQVYVYEDIAQNSTAFEASPVATLGGKSVTEYLAYIATTYNTVGVGE